VNGSTSDQLLQAVPIDSQRTGTCRLQFSRWRASRIALGRAATPPRPKSHNHCDEVLERCCVRIEAALTGDDRFEFQQIKEKYGGLRIYWGAARAKFAVKRAAPIVAATGCRPAASSRGPRPGRSPRRPAARRRRTAGRLDRFDYRRTPLCQMYNFAVRALVAIASGGFHKCGHSLECRPDRGGAKL
jgi:hypothetical protein